jgi:hypothetical protein
MGELQYEAAGFVAAGATAGNCGASDPLGHVEKLCDWSRWMPFSEALEAAPRLPGVYMAREGCDGRVVYVGMAGERAGGRLPQGIRGRLAVYIRGKGLASGLGEAVFDRALADPAWLAERVAEAEVGRPMRAKAWGQAAFARADLNVRWAVTADKASAVALERACLDALANSELWNRYR